MDSLRAALSVSQLCRPESWPDDVDELAALYDDKLNSILDILVVCNFMWIPILILASTAASASPSTLNMSPR